MFHDIKEVVFHPYRTVRVTDVFLVLPRDKFRPIEQMLAELAGGIRPDNHTAYSLTNLMTDEVTHISCSDMSVRFGRTLEKRKW